jgi:hypothetical protein
LAKLNDRIGIRVSFEDIESATPSRCFADEPDTRFAHVNVYVVVRTADGSDWEIPRAWHDDAGWADGVHLRAQTDSLRLRSGTTPEHAMYGYQPEWKGSDSGISELERGVKALRKIVKGIDALQASDGPPQSFGQYLLRFAKSLGASRMVIQARNKSWHTYKLADGVYAVDSRIREWHASVNPKHPHEVN